MGLKQFRPTSPGRRGMTAVTTEELTKKAPEKGLTAFHVRTGGTTTVA
jgi:large subunit ribosomal protein L2